jgi:lipopolysaccharide export system protein LptA
MSPDHARHSKPVPRRHALPRAIVLACVLLPMAVAMGRSSDRNKPLDIEAGSQSGVFSSDSVNILSGGVHITQGTLDIESQTARLTMSGGEVVRAVFSGGPVVMSQEMDDGTPMKARADNIDYNLKTEIVVFTGNVSIEQPRGSMSGGRVVYNLQTGSVESGGEGSGRVKMRILPRNSDGDDT